MISISMMGILARPPSASIPITPDLPYIQSVFSGSTGAMYDFTDTDTLFSDENWTTPAVVGGAIRSVLDVSGLGKHAKTSSTNITLQLDGGVHYAQFAGGAAGFYTTTGLLGSSAGNSQIASYRAANHTNTMALISSDLAGGRINQGVQIMNGSDSGGMVVTYFYEPSGNYETFSETDPRLAGIDHVASVVVDDAGGRAYMDGELVASISAEHTPVTASAARITLGSSDYGTPTHSYLPYSGRMYGGAFISKELSNLQRRAFENYFESKIAGVSAPTNIASDAWAIYALNKLVSTYSGPLITVRRASDNALINVVAGGDGNLDVSTLLAHCGAGDGYLTEWYDQTGNGRNLAQTTNTKQPKVVSSGVFLNHVAFNGTSDVMSSILTAPASTVWSVATRLSATAGSYFLTLNATPNDANSDGLLMFGSDANVRLGVVAAGSEGYVAFGSYVVKEYYNERPSTDDIVFTTVQSSGLQVDVRKNSTLLVPSNVAANGGGLANFRESTLVIGARGLNSSDRAVVSFKSLVLYPNNKLSVASTIEDVLAA